MLWLEAGLIFPEIQDQNERYQVHELNLVIMQITANLNILIHYRVINQDAFVLSSSKMEKLLTLKTTAENRVI